MFKKVLPFKYPSITGMPPIAYLFSILETKPETKSWIISNYMNNYITKAGSGEFWGRDNFFNNCPWIFENSIPRELIKAYNHNIIDFCKENIQLNYYIYIVINKKHIKAYNEVNDADHNMLIYGIDEEHQLVYIADFFISSKYSFCTCSFDELISAFDDPFIDNTGYYELIRTIKLKDIQFVLEPDLVKINIEDYISSTNLFCKYNRIPYETTLEFTKNKQYTYLSNNYLINNYYFGLEFYSHLIHLVKEEEYRSIRTFHLIYDKMILMRIRLEYFMKCGLISNYEELNNLNENNITHALTLRNMVIKSIIAKNNELNKSILKKLNLLADEECKFYNTLLASL